MAVYDHLQYFRELFTNTKWFMFVKLFARIRLSFHSCFEISVLCQSVTFISQMVSYLADFGDVDLFGVPPILDLLKEQLIFSVLLLDFGQQDAFLIARKPC